jgi:hypothetical protein
MQFLRYSTPSFLILLSWKAYDFKISIFFTLFPFLSFTAYSVLIISTFPHKSFTKYVNRNSSFSLLSHHIKLLKFMFCKGFDQRFTRLQLCKHGPARNSIWGCVFYVVRATPNATNGPINSQSDTWHLYALWSATCKNRGGCVFCAWSVPLWYKRIREWELTWIEFPGSKGIAVWPKEELEDLECEVTCAVVHSYWECVIQWEFYSSCVINQLTGNRQ